VTYLLEKENCKRKTIKAHISQIKEYKADHVKRNSYPTRVYKSRRHNCGSPREEHGRQSAIMDWDNIRDFPWSGEHEDTGSGEHENAGVGEGVLLESTANEVSFLPDDLQSPVGLWDMDLLELDVPVQESTPDNEDQSAIVHFSDSLDGSIGFSGFEEQPVDGILANEDQSAVLNFSDSLDPSVDFSGFGERQSDDLEGGSCSELCFLCCPSNSTVSKNQKYSNFGITHGHK